MRNLLIASLLLPAILLANVTQFHSVIARKNASSPEFITLDGVNDYVISGDDDGLDNFGHQEIQAHIALDDWTPATDQVIASRWVETGDDRAWSFHVNATTGYLEYEFSTDGTAATVRTLTTTIAPTVSDGAELWVSAQLDPDSSRNVRFRTSTDGVTWTLLQDRVFTGSEFNTFTTMIDDAGVNGIELGSRNAGTSNFMAGKYYEFRHWEGLSDGDGLKSAQFVAADLVAGVAPDANKSNYDLLVDGAYAAYRQTNILANSGFDDTSVWRDQTGWTISGGVATANNPANFTLWQGGGEEGTYYWVECTITNWNAGGELGFRIGNQGGIWGFKESLLGPAPVTFQIVQRMQGNSNFLTQSSLFYGSIDNWTARPVARVSQADWTLKTGPVSVTLDGTASTYISQADNAATSITGDIDLRWWGSLPDWTPGGQAMLVTKQGNGYGLEVRGGGGGNVLRWSWNDGSNRNVDSTVAPSSVFSDGDSGWIRITMDVDNGASGADIKFYTGGDSESPSWTQLGATVTYGSTTSNTDTGQNVVIGASNNGSAVTTAMDVKEVQILNGVAGTIVSRFQASAVSGSTATDQAPTPIGDWTLNGGYTVNY